MIKKVLLNNLKKILVFMKNNFIVSSVHIQEIQNDQSMIIWEIYIKEKKKLILKLVIIIWKRNFLDKSNKKL